MHGGWEPPGLLRWVRSYLDDVLCLPVVLAAVLATLRLHRRRPGLTLPLSVGLVALAGYALWFEGVLPLLDSRATADVRDVPAYGAGLVLFMVWINRPGPAPVPPEEE